MPRPKPVLLLILDGWGHRENADHNAVALARLPNWQRLLTQYPHTLVDTFGEHVGLPDGQMGNSEVGHMNIGAGRVVWQELTRIDKAIRDGVFYANPALVSACDAATRTGGTLHVMGLASPGGVHSSDEHILAMLELGARRKVPRVRVHAFLDGRDTPPKSARATLEKLAAKCAELSDARIASASGRYYAMDRDKRWDRVERAWNAVVEGRAEYHAPDAITALEAAYARGETDEFVLPTVIDPPAPMQDGDAVVFMNFRADRARQLSHALLDADFTGFARARRPALSAFVSLTEYEKGLPVTAVAYTPQSLDNTLGEYLAAQGLSQLRIAETEKYAHVTFFFSGGREAPFPGEERILIPSPKVATYDLKPEMSAPEVTTALVEAIHARRFDFIVCNLANADMVGHSGKLDAAVKAAEAIDEALGKLTAAITESGGEMLISADHGNLEQMQADDGQPHTQHTVGPVPLVYVGRKAKLEHGALSDLAPTVLAVMGLPQPREMSGRSLVHFAA
jgi:2,3-bisphosphoglycerate-independent phosphoglycerate mutase